MLRLVSARRRLPYLPNGDLPLQVLIRNVQPAGDWEEKEKEDRK